MTAPKFVRVTIKEVFEAIEKNGLEHLRGEWITRTYKDGKFVPVAGCVLMQGAYNLNVFPAVEALEEQFDDCWECDEWHDAAYNYSLQKQLNEFYVPANSKWFERGYSGVGDAIIYWNDLMREGEWVLPTYKDVVDMVRDLLTPLFEVEIMLAVIDENSPVKFTTGSGK